MVENSYDTTLRLTLQQYVSLGFIVICIDNIGSSGRGNNYNFMFAKLLGFLFESKIYRKMGQVEISDQVSYEIYRQVTFLGGWN